MWKAMCELFQTSPFSLIYDGNYEALEKRLNGGLSPDFCLLGRSLLVTAIRHNRKDIAVLLLEHNANVNLNVSERSDNPFFAITEAYCHFDRALLKFMLSYGAEWDCINSPLADETYTELEFVKSVAPQCRKIYTSMKEGDTLLKSERYDLAHEKFSTANELLKAFAQEEKKKLSEKDKGYNSDVVFLNDYLNRSKICQEKISLCQLEQEKTLECEPESAPLLSKKGKEWDLENLRRRQHSHSAPTSCSSSSTQSGIASSLASNANKPS